MGVLFLQNVKGSKFLEKKNNLMKDIIEELTKEFKYCSILGTDVRGKEYLVQKSGSSFNDSNWNERGFVVRVYNGINYTEYSFNHLIADKVEQIIDEVKKKAQQELKLITKKFELINYPLVNEDEISEEYFGEVKLLPNSITISDKLSKMNRIKDKALPLSEKIVDFRVRYEDVKVSKVFISNNKELKQSYIWSQGYLIAIARKDDDTRFFYKTFSGLKGPELLDEMENSYQEVVEKAESLIGTEPPEPGTYDVICDPDTAGIIAHEAFGHGVEADMFVKNRAKALEYLDRDVASKNVTMYDGARSANHVSSYLFDDEGTIGQNTKIIDNGILKKGISDLLSALLRKTEPTGNGKRESYERKAYSRMTNTFFASGDAELAEMIASIESGYLLENPMSGMEDPKNWGIQCVMISGKEIKNGKLTGNIVAPVLMTGYVPDLLKNISMVAKEVKLSGSGACGKGYKELVKVSSGGPYIKTKARLG